MSKKLAIVLFLAILAVVGCSPNGAAPVNFITATPGSQIGMSPTQAPAQAGLTVPEIAGTQMAATAQAATAIPTVSQAEVDAYIATQKALTPTVQAPTSTLQAPNPTSTVVAQSTAIPTIVAATQTLVVQPTAEQPRSATISSQASALAADLSAGIIIPVGQGCAVVNNDVLYTIQKQTMFMGFLCVDTPTQKWDKVDFVQVPFAYQNTCAKGFDIVGNGQVLPTEALQANEPGKNVHADAYIPWTFLNRCNFQRDAALDEAQYLWPSLFGVTPKASNGVLVGNMDFFPFSFDQQKAQSLARKDKVAPVVDAFDSERGNSPELALFMGGIAVVTIVSGDKVLMDQVLVILNPCWSCGGNTTGTSLDKWAGHGTPKVGEKFSALNLFVPMPKNGPIVTIFYAVMPGSVSEKLPANFIVWRGESDPKGQ